MSITKRASDPAAPRQRGSPWGATLTELLRQRIHDTGLLPRLLVAEVAVFILVFAGGVLLISQITASLRDNIRRERLVLGRAAAEDLDAALFHSISELQGLAERYRSAGDTGEFQGASNLTAGKSEMFTRGIFVVGPGGEVLMTDQRDPGSAELDLKEYWPGLWNHRPGRAEVMTATFQVEGLLGPTVAIGVPVGAGAGGEFVVGLVDATDSYPAQIVDRAVRLGGSGHADIVDQNGIALFSTERDHLFGRGDHPTSYKELFKEGGPIISELPDENKEDDGHLEGTHLMAFVPLQAMPWAISTGTTVSEAYASARELWYGGLGFLALLTGVAFVATVYAGRKLVQPVKALSGAAKSVAEGDRDVTINIPWGGEIGELGRSLETMRLRLQTWGSELEERVKERTQELEDRHRELRTLNERLQENEEQLRTLLGKVLGAQEDERRRVSRELHDGIGQALSALSMGLESLEQPGRDRWRQVQENVETLKQLANDTLTDLRRMTIALRPAALDDLGLVPAIRRYADLYLRSAGVDFSVSEEGANTRLDPALETVIYRVVQEAINNVARHSEATRVEISLRSTDGAVLATVEDNGRGFDTADAKSRQGVGLQGMEERASLAGGKLTVESGPRSGTKIHLEIPLTERVETAGDA